MAIAGGTTQVTLIEAEPSIILRVVAAQRCVVYSSSLKAFLFAC